MTSNAQTLPPNQANVKAEPSTAFGVLSAISFAHLLNDMIQSLILAIYPMLKGEFHLSFAQIGLITLTYQLTASLLQPLVGWFTDRRPQPYSLPIGMTFTLSGLLLLSIAPTFALVLIAAALVGTGSSIFHPESSRVARMASGGRHGLAQSLFQVGGNLGSSLGPLLAAAIIVPHGQGSIAWISAAALLAIVVLLQISTWYAHHRTGARGKSAHRSQGMALPRSKVIGSVAILLTLIFSKYFYMASISSYLTFYLISRFHIGVQAAQLHLFAFLFAVAVGTVVGGPIGDRFGRKHVIWVSILGVAPFTLLLPYVDLFWTGVLTVIIGLIIASAFSAILVYAQELIPGRVGMVSGLFFGFAFGMGGIGAAVLGSVADSHGIDFVYHLCAYLPLLGIVTALLPDLRRR
ncbi:FSR family fosmidomycin resistance protein-like MFS transporter [Herbaspirillum sp. Sphag1AN]|uniref:MFS transporter n=1 Tax=unclassified Herbaspirillum TaxID=2624150 RepID=UPI00161DF32F|nr:MULTISPECIES: MFS transporter [unclassified Herbaspirillum]MBB3212219.1 FSR family fosmidomycin resistance protein-like MFS transporter [Herbaspirillum sp. Sphag1AN]MBB3245683.1 FSR family fosmidomycin resistance protein-like MFS transporter [Herbaspirillum sp. Sphag64]